MRNKSSLWRWGTEPLLSGIHHGSVVILNSSSHFNLWLSRIDLFALLQMSLMKKNMKSVQEHFFKEMVREPKRNGYFILKVTEFCRTEIKFFCLCSKRKSWRVCEEVCNLCFSLMHWGSDLRGKKSTVWKSLWAKMCLYA